MTRISLFCPPQTINVFVKKDTSDTFPYKKKNKQKIKNKITNEKLETYIILCLACSVCHDFHISKKKENHFPNRIRIDAVAILTKQFNWSNLDQQNPQ